jgi:hypothetical protein
MPIKVKWFYEGLVIHAQLEGILTGPDLTEYADNLDKLIATSDAPLIHLITDLSGMEMYPSLGEVMRSLHMPPRLGWTLVMGAKTNKIVRFLMQVITSSMRLRFRELESIDEAVDFLQKMDTTLPDLQLFRESVTSV